MTPIRVKTYNKPNSAQILRGAPRLEKPEK